MLSHDPAFGFHLSHKNWLATKKHKKHKTINAHAKLGFKFICAFCAFFVASKVFRAFLWPYSANHPFASRSLTPMRRLPSMSSIHDPFTSAVSLPPNGGTNFTVEPTTTSTSRRSVAPPRLILVAFAFA